MQRVFTQYLSLIFLGIAGVALIALQQHIIGWISLIIGAFLLFFCHKTFRRHLLLIYIPLAILGITPITTDISLSHITHMGVLLTIAVTLPYFVSRFVYKDHVIKFRWQHGRKWYKTEIVYVLVTAVISYLLLPFMLYTSGSYTNWTVEGGAQNLLLLFLGTNLLGIWDELFFINTVFAILRKHLTFAWANLLQAVLFTSFLYELGFRGYMFVVIFLFALLQGYVFKKTDSLLYVITIHLTLDLILYLALIHAYHPDWMPIFLITGR